MYSVKCYLNHTVGVFTVSSVVYDDGKIVLGVENESYLVADCPDLGVYELIVDSLYTNGKVSIVEEYNFKWF